MRWILLTSLLVVGFSTDLCFGGGVCTSAPSAVHHAHDGDDVHGHPHHHHHDEHHGHGCAHDHGHHEHRRENVAGSKSKLPEELAEEEDMRLYGFANYHSDDHHHHHHDDAKLSGLGLWFNALGCSLLVSLASLICLILLPVIFIQGKPSKAIVDSLALFGAGAMLGDAFLHQLPHAFGGEHSHAHDHHTGHSHHAHDGHGHSHSHSHSLEDLSIGLAVLAGIVLFLLVEKLVRYVEANATDANAWSHGHHHHHHKSIKKMKNEDNDVHENGQSQFSKKTTEKELDDVSEDSLNGNKIMQNESHLRKRKATLDGIDNKSEDALDGSDDTVKSLNAEKSSESQSSLVFGYLNLFSDGVHNFTDGMALGSAFLLYGSVGGWSRTLFLLAHELPQEVGDFGILVRSGFSVPKALFFNFLSALVALAGTAMVLLWGRDPGQSSLIEGFTAGGFIYISVAGVLAEMNNDSVKLRSTVMQLIALVTGMAVALGISLVE